MDKGCYYWSLNEGGWSEPQRVKGYLIGSYQSITTPLLQRLTIRRQN